MECPYGCGDMEQLVSIANVVDVKTEDLPQKYVQIIYERCDECGHEENIDVIITEEKNQNKQEEKHE